MAEKLIKVKILKGVGHNGAHLAPGSVAELPEEAVAGLLKYAAVSLVDKKVTVAPTTAPTTPVNKADIKESAPAPAAPEAAAPAADEEAAPAVDEEAAPEGLEVFDFLKEEQVAALTAAGYTGIEEIQKATKADLDAVETVGDATVKKLIEKAAEFEVVEG